MHRGSGVWETNFESEFEIDGQIHSVVSKLQNYRPFGYNVGDWIEFLKISFEKHRNKDTLCKYYTFDEPFHRRLLLLIHSLVIRSPSNRSIFENFPAQFGLPMSEDVGKANMFQQYRMARRLCEKGLIPIDAFVLLHSPFRRFICGDGHLSSLVSSLHTNRIQGRALIPLTPHLCVYFTTKSMGRQSNNVASTIAPLWMVDWVNNLTQIYSRDRLFFKGRPPKLTEPFHKRKFLQLKYHSDELIERLDRIAGKKETVPFFR